MIKKELKIHVVVSADPTKRKHMLAKLAVRMGFARIPSDAVKLMASDIYSIDLQRAYFVLCPEYNFRGATLTNQRLYEMAARGIFVGVGVKSIPREYEFICCSYYSEDFR